MMTPAHILISIAGLTWGETERAESLEPPEKSAGDHPSYLWPAVIGAVLPDAPMFGFYAIEKFVFGSSEREIWDTRYFLDGWQSFFDAFNSIPLCLICMLIAWRTGCFSWVVLFGSMLIHCLCDLPLHHDDGHRHFWPLLDWRFASPVSYWDPRHHGVWGAASELVISAICFWIAVRRHKSTVRRIAIGLLGAIYALMSIGYFVMVFRGVEM